MHVAVNALFLRPGEVGGTERYLRELLARLLAIEPSDKWTVFLPAEARGAFTTLAPRLTEVGAPIRAAARIRRVLAEQTWLRARIESLRPDVLWNPGASLPWALSVPQVTTVHDCVSRSFPGQFGFFEKLAIERHVAAAVGISRKILVPSESVRADLIRHYGAVPEKLLVTPEAASAKFQPTPEDRDDLLRKDAGLGSGEYFLCASSLLPHKRIEPLLDAYAVALASTPGLPRLVWMGPGDPGKVRTWASARGIAEKVAALGWSPMDSMPALVRGARACLLPSLFEGFGLSALEALACGTPLLAAPSAAVREVAGDACLYCEDPSARSWAARIVEIGTLEALRKRLAAAGPARAARFSWEKTAASTLAALLEAAYQ